MFLPMQEYFAGMDCPFANASLVSCRDMLASEVANSIVAASVMTDAGFTGCADAHAEIKTDIKTNKDKMVCFIPNPRV